MARSGFHSKVSNLMSAFAAVLENVEVECRNDEDCDHCWYVQCADEVEKELEKHDKRVSNKFMRDHEPCGSCGNRICLCGDGPNV